MDKRPEDTTVAEAAQELLRDVKIYIYLLQEAEMIAKRAEKMSAKEFIAKKQVLMINAVNSIPLGARSCPYCLGYSMNCQDCPYGEEKGLCTEENSVYSDIKKAQLVLLEKLRDYALR